MLGDRAVLEQSLRDDLDLRIGQTLLDFRGVEDREAVVQLRRVGDRWRRQGAEAAENGAVHPVAVVADRYAVYRAVCAQRLDREARDHLRLRRVGDIDRVVVRIPEVADVIRQPVGRNVAFMTDRCLRQHDATVVSGADRHRRHQLRRTAVARNVVDVHFGSAAAVLAVVGDQDLAPRADAQRLPRVLHRRRCQRRDTQRLGPVGDIDHRNASVLAVRVRNRSRVIGATVTRAIGERSRRPVAAFVLRLPDQGQVAIEAFETRGTHRRRHLSLEPRLRRAPGGAGCNLRHRERYHAGVGAGVGAAAGCKNGSRRDRQQYEDGLRLIAPADHVCVSSMARWFRCRRERWQSSRIAYRMQGQVFHKSVRSRRANPSVVRRDGNRYAARHRCRTFHRRTAFA